MHQALCWYKILVATNVPRGTLFVVCDCVLKIKRRVCVCFHDLLWVSVPRGTLVCVGGEWGSCIGLCASAHTCFFLTLHHVSNI